ncbi:MAG: hypothetical protein LLF76_02900 [Planctomycetaceae bacterium]|nr:hypothetical protein [Planctomycetaceae bacterium]
MLTAKDLYPDYDGGYGPRDYQPMLESFGTILLQVDDDDYQGDSRVLYQDAHRIGYLQFGWGSCSGCDALQAVFTVQGLDNLIKELRDSVIWFDSPREALEYFNRHDWGGDYSWHSEEQKQFIHRAIALLEHECAAMEACYV